MERILVHCEKELTQVALLEDDLPVGYFIERSAERKQVAGSIYKGKVMNVLPGMQAAFVDIGMEKNAFLYIDDLIPAHSDKHAAGKPDISDLLSPGQELLVQVVKEAAGTKGARISTHFSLPGRSLVFMPGAEYVGISRRIEEEGERERLKALGESLRGRDEGLILRTVSSGEAERVLAQELNGLRELWSDILEKAENSPAPSLIYLDLDMLHRVVRDWFTETVDEIIVDAEKPGRELKALLSGMSPGLERKVSFYQESQPLFDKFGIGEELLKVCKRKVWLNSGAYLIVERTEALTVIDVNTGKYTGSVNLEHTVFDTNLAAAREIARIIRLRDLSGIIIIDFIDMEEEDHRQMIVRELEKLFKRDRTKTLVVGWTRLGLLELTRKKVRESLDETIFVPCSQCQGRGKVYSPEAGRNHALPSNP